MTQRHDSFGETGSNEFSGANNEVAAKRSRIISPQTLGKIFKVAGITAGASGLLGGVLALKSFTIIPSGSYGVDVDFGQMKSDHVPPGKYWTNPFFEKMYTLNNNTIIWDTDNVGSGKNTLDQNELRGDIRTHIKVDPKVGSLALTINQVGSDHGKSAMSKLQDASFDAVAGGRAASDSVQDPVGLLKAFKANLEWRIAQNNLPIKVDAIELKDLNVGGSTGFRKVVQLRILSDNTVVSMSGPAAISVTTNGVIVTPSSVSTQSGPVTGGQPTTPVGPLPVPNPAKAIP